MKMTCCNFDTTTTTKQHSSIADDTNWSQDEPSSDHMTSRRRKITWRRAVVRSYDVAPSLQAKADVYLSAFYSTRSRSRLRAASVCRPLSSRRRGDPVNNNTCTLTVCGLRWELTKLTICIECIHRYCLSFTREMTWLSPVRWRMYMY